MASSTTSSSPAAFAADQLVVPADLFDREGNVLLASYWMIWTTLD